MATDKLFTVAGISKLNGEYKVRFANDMMRIKVLAKSGHEDIRLADLEGLKQVDAARLMHISRPTFSRIVALARNKVADGLVNIKVIRIEGGCCKVGNRLAQRSISSMS